MSEYKEYKIIDENVLSGSSDRLRLVLGNYWTEISGAMGIMLHLRGNIETSDEIEEIDAGLTSYDIEDSEISTVLTNPLLRATTSADVYVPNFNIPVRLIGNSALIESDANWHAYLFGASYGETSYIGIYNENVYDDYCYNKNTAYSAIEEKKIQYLQGTFDGVNSEILPEYNYYLREYQEYATTLRERQLPNMYMFNPDILDSVDTEDVMEVINNYITVDGNADSGDIAALLEATETEQLPDRQIFIDASSTDGAHKDVSYNLRKYLSSSFLEISASTLENIESSMENIILGATSANKLLGPDSLYRGPDGYRKYFPYSIRINIPVEIKEKSPIRDIFSDHNYDNNLLVGILNASFDQGYGAIEQITYYSASLEAETVTSVAQTSRAVNRISMDFLSRMFSIYASPLTTTNKPYINVDKLDTETQSLLKLETPYRFLNTQKTVNVIKDFVSTQSVLQPTIDPEEDNYFDITSIWDIYNQCTTGKLSEPIAYKIQKLYLGEVVQNIWIYNDNTQESFEYYDSQIKYNTDYEYRIYEYEMVIGLKYKYGDWRYSSQIGSSTADTHCLQLSDSDGDVANSIFGTDTLATEITPIAPSSGWSTWADSGFEDSAYAAYIDEYGVVPTHGSVTDEEGNTSPSRAEYNAWAISTIVYVYSTGRAVEVATYEEIDDPFGTDSVIESEHPYLAEFKVYYEPNIRIVESLIETKTLRVSDHAPTRVEVSPFQMIDDSQRIGFKVAIDSWDPAPLPAPLTTEDSVYFNNYISSNDFITDDEAVTESNRSRAVKIEVYRLDEKPSAYNQFNDNLYKTYALNTTSDDSYDTMIHCIDVIQTNKKYYYMFRSVSMLGISGEMSDIYETELINDGGYKYAIFNVITPTDLEKVENIPVSIPIKKLFYIKPSMDNLVIGGDLDYGEPAHTQMENVEVGNAEHPIWDKKFKFRLTSKKTGKKIDFNITYKVREG